MNITTLLHRLILNLFSLQEKNINLTPEMKTCLNLIEQNQQHIFIIGRAGTGKTTLIKHIRDNLDKKVVVLAPTGLAAVHIGGQTIHSFFRLPHGILDQERIHKLHVRSREIYRSMDLLIIDEVSMVRADLLDAIDLFLRMYGRNKKKPFGGIPVIFVGDLYQLPPVVGNAERNMYNQLYDTPYFFNAHVMQKIIDDLQIIPLKRVFRQTDPVFKTLLDKVRIGRAGEQELQTLNQRVDPLPRNRLCQSEKTGLCLTTTNASARAINTSCLLQISKQEKTYQAVAEGKFLDRQGKLPQRDDYPAEIKLTLKPGARVLFIKNDGDKRWVNGTLGVVTGLENNHVEVRLEKSGDKVPVERETWYKYEYRYNKEEKKIEQLVVGSFTQFPLRLGWAITIHKSQGMTLNRVYLDLSSSPFAYGQTYVALSRCTSLTGLRLSNKLYPNHIMVDPEIIRWRNYLYEKKVRYKK